MGRKSKDEVQDAVEEVVQEDVQESVQTDDAVEEVKSDSKCVAMVRDESYPEPRQADVHPEEVEEWSKHGWVKK